MLNALIQQSIYSWEFSAEAATYFHLLLSILLAYFNVVIYKYFVLYCMYIINIDGFCWDRRSNDRTSTCERHIGFSPISTLISHQPSSRSGHPFKKYLISNFLGLYYFHALLLRILWVYGLRIFCYRIETSPP